MSDPELAFGDEPTPPTSKGVVVLVAFFGALSALLVLTAAFFLYLGHDMSQQVEYEQESILVLQEEIEKLRKMVSLEEALVEELENLELRAVEAGGLEKDD